MNKPNGYEKAASNAPKTVIRLGGHKAKIVEVEERQNKNGGDMLVVKFDFHSDDDQANYFVGLKSADSDKWPNGGTVYINVNAWDNPDETSKQFKGFCTAFSDSNNCEVPWGTDFSKSMKGKKIGVVFGEEESIWKDELFIGRKCRWFCDFSKAADQEVPKRKEIAQSKLPKKAEEGGTEFLDLSGVDNDSLPFG